MSIPDKLTEAVTEAGQAQWTLNYQLGKRAFSKRLTTDAVNQLQKAIKILQPLIGDDDPIG